MRSIVESDPITAFVKIKSPKSLVAHRVLNIPNAAHVLPLPEWKNEVIRRRRAAVRRAEMLNPFSTDLA